MARYAVSFPLLMSQTSIEFYRKLGFEPRNTLESQGQLVWA